jgi:hypothetical protein
MEGAKEHIKPASLFISTTYNQNGKCKVTNSGFDLN